ncbi:MAG: hypothetical protein QM755_02970 [Luteolibacter sp.]
MLGCVIYQMLADYGLGFEVDFESPEQSYTLTVKRVNPTDNYAVFVECPKDWKSKYTDDEFKDLLAKQGIKKTDILEISRNVSQESIYMKAKYEACRRFYFLADQARR